MFKRDFEQHSKMFEDFNVVFIGETDNCEAIEKLFEQDLKAWKLHRTYRTYGKEFFTVSDKYTIGYLINYMKKLIEENPLPAVIKAKNELKKIELETEKNKSKTKNLKLEIQLESKKHKSKQLDLQLEKERKK